LPLANSKIIGAPVVLDTLLGGLLFWTTGGLTVGRAVAGGCAVATVVVGVLAAMTGIGDGVVATVEAPKLRLQAIPVLRTMAAIRKGTIHFIVFTGSHHLNIVLNRSIIY